MLVKKLKSDFRFGFEFEGFAELDSFMGDIQDYDYCHDYWYDLDCNGLNDDDYDEFYENVNNFINRKFKATSGRTHYDGSVKNYSNGFQSFEYSSPVFKFNVRNFKKLKDFFSNMDMYGFAINKTCGFHTHISFPSISEYDAIWMLCQIANNKDYINEFCYMKTKSDIINFYSDKYANKDFLYEIHDALQTNDVDKLLKNLNDSKYRVIRIHPQGTLEWRGPRDFLNIPNGIDFYLQKLNKIISILSDVMSTNMLNGLTKAEFFNQINKYVKRCYIEGCSFSSSSKITKRCGKLGLVDNFGKSRLKYNPYTVALRLSKTIESKPHVLTKIDNDLILDNLILTLHQSNKLDNTINKIKESHIRLPLIVKKNILKYYSEYLYILSPEEIRQLSISEIMHYIDNINYSTNNEERVKKIYSAVKFILRNCDKTNLLSFTFSFVNNSLKTIKPIVELISEGLYKDVDIKTIYTKYVRTHDLLVQHRVINKLDLPYKPLELYNKFKHFMMVGLIPIIENDDDFTQPSEVNGSINHVYHDVVELPY